MNLQEYVLSKMCHCRDAAVWGMTKLNPSHFTGPGRTYYSIIKSLYKLYNGVDLHTFVSQSAAQRLKESDANEIYQYAQGQTDEWQNVFQEFKTESIKRNIRNDLQELITIASNGHSVSEITSKATSKAMDWISDTEKRYYSGQEIDEMDEQYGNPILTGFPIYDEQIYKYGGNLRGQMKGVICRQKHGKTRSACWEVAQNIRMGHKVLYLTLESTKKKIVGNIKEVLREDWKKYRNNLFVVDGYRMLDDLSSITIEAVLIDGVEKVVVDYAQNMIPNGRFSGENEKINICIQEYRHLMVKYNFLCVILSQARKNTQQSVMTDYEGNFMLPKGWRYVPKPEDSYGSQELVNACTMMEIGFRPSAYEENIIETALSKKVLNPLKQEDSFFSLYFQIALTRNKPEYLHQWWRFTDSDSGLQNPVWL